MSNYYGNRLVKFVSPQCDRMFCLELGGNEEELKELIATILNISITELKGIKDSHNNYYTFSSAIRNQSLTNTYSQYYTIVLSNAFTGNNNQMKRSSSLNINALSQNFDQAIIDTEKRKNDNKLKRNHQSLKQDQLLGQLVINKLLNEKHIEKIQSLLRNDNNKRLITLINNYDGYDLVALSKQILVLTSKDNLEMNDKHSHNNKNNNLKPITYHDTILSLDEHFEDKSDIKLLYRLLSFDNELLKSTLNEYGENNNKIRLIDKLKQIVSKYKDKLSSNPDSNPLSLSTRRSIPINTIKKGESIIENNYNSIINKLSFDQKAILEYAKSSVINYHQLFELDKLFSNSNNENNSINLIKKYCNEFIHNYIIVYLSNEEIKIFHSVINDKENNKNIVKAFEIFKSKGFNINELKENIQIIIKELLSQQHLQQQKQELLPQQQKQKKMTNKSENKPIILNNSNEPENKRDEKKYILNENNRDKKTINLSYKNNILGNNPNTQRNNNNDSSSSNTFRLNKKESDKTLSKELLNESATEIKKLNDFVKVIASFSFEENIKSSILKLIEEKEERIMKIFQNYQKNKMSLTKNILLAIVKDITTSSTTNSQNSNNNNNNNNVNNNYNNNNNNNNSIKNISFNNNLFNMNNIQGESTLPNSLSPFNTVIDYFEKEKMISLGESLFIKKRYQNNDEMLLSFWEVFRSSNNELSGFIESLKAFIGTHQAKNANSPEPMGSKTPISITNTKKDLINIFRSKEKSESEVIKNKQRQIITLLLKEELMEESAEQFFNMKIDEEDPLLSSVFEVFSVTRDHRDFIESLNLIREIMYNKDNNSNSNSKDDNDGDNNNSFTHSLKILNSLLQKSSFNDNQKEILRAALRQKEQTVLSALELFETGKDVDKALETLEITAKKKKKVKG